MDDEINCGDDGTDSSDVSRRGVLKLSAATAAGGVLGTAAMGTAGASHDCTDSADYSRDDSYHWSYTDDAWTQEYCSGPGDVQKAELVAGILYYGSCKDAYDKWVHYFTAGGHSESFSISHYTGCGRENDDWSRSAYMYEHAMYFQNNIPEKNDIPLEKGSRVGAHPSWGDTDYQGLETELMYTVLAEVIGAAPFSWHVGAAMSIAATLDDYTDQTEDDTTTQYKWKNRNDQVHCLSHFVSQSVKEAFGASTDNVDFTYYDEHWVEVAAANERYVQESFHVYYYDEKDGDCNDTSTSSSLSTQSTCESTFEASGVPDGTSVGDVPKEGVPQPGDVVVSGDGRRVLVEDVETNRRTHGGTPAEQRAAADLPGPVGDDLDIDGEVTFRRLPLAVDSVSIAGRALPQRGNA